MTGVASGLKEDRKKVLINAFLMASGTMTSRILGLLRDMALAAFFDRTLTDAWTAAFRLPNLFRRLFGEGSLSVSFIPVFIETQLGDSSGTRSRNLLNAFYTLLLVFLSVLTLVGILCAEPILEALLDNAYREIPGKFELTVRMAQIMFGFVFFICTYAYFMGILNALGVFGLPALAPTLFNISMLAFTFMPPAWFPQPGDGLAWGVLVGGALQMLVLWPALKAKGYLPSLTMQWWSADVRLILKNMVPGLVGMGLLQFTTLVNLRFASGLDEGAISYIYWADRLLELPLSLVSVSLGAALLPRLSELWSRGEKQRLAETLQENLLVNFYLAWPAALGLFFLAEPLVQVLFMRGQFSVVDAAATAQVLKIYAGMLIFVASSRVLVAAFYAVKNTTYPAVVVVVSLAVHILLAPELMKHLGLNGLVLSSLVTSALSLALLMARLPSQVVSLQWRVCVRSLLKMILAGAVLILAVKITSPSMQMNAGDLALSILFGGAAYLAISYLLKLQEFQSTFAVLWNKLKTKIRP
ncbi:putative peptidoglycan biosynthesis protein MurJ [compost metagenome]